MRVQTFIKKGSGRILEDALIVKPPVFGVFDGATGLDDFTTNKGLTGGYLAAQLAKKVFTNSRASLIATVEKLNRQLLVEMKKSRINTKDKFRLWALALAVVKIRKNYFEWVQSTDSPILVIYENNKWDLLVKDYEIDLDLLLLWQKYAKQKTKDIFSVIKPVIIEKREKENQTYGVIDGNPRMKKFLRSGKLSLKDVKHIILFTDGLLPPKKDPRKKDDFLNFVRLFNKGGLRLIAKTHWGLQNKDPWGWQYIRLKKHDDMAAIALSF